MTGNLGEGLRNLRPGGHDCKRNPGGKWLAAHQDVWHNPQVLVRPHRSSSETRSRREVVHL